MRWYPSADTRICYDYHGGMGSMLYALSSCGYLGIGTEEYRNGRTDKEWLRELLLRLDGELVQVLGVARQHWAEDVEPLEDLLSEVEEALATL